MAIKRQVGIPCDDVTGIHDAIVDAVLGLAFEHTESRQRNIHGDFAFLDTNTFRDGEKCAIQQPVVGGRHDAVDQHGATNTEQDRQAEPGKQQADDKSASKRRGCGR